MIRFGHYFPKPWSHCLTLFCLVTPCWRWRWRDVPTGRLSDVTSWRGGLLEKSCWTSGCWMVVSASANYGLQAFRTLNWGSAERLTSKNSLWQGSSFTYPFSLLLQRAESSSRASRCPCSANPRMLCQPYHVVQPFAKRVHTFSLLFYPWHYKISISSFGLLVCIT